MTLREANATTRLQREADRTFYLGMSKVQAQLLEKDLIVAARDTGYTKHLDGHLLHLRSIQLYGHCA